MHADEQWDTFEGPSHARWTDQRTSPEDRYRHLLDEEARRAVEEYARNSGPREPVLEVPERPRCPAPPEGIRLDFESLPGWNRPKVEPQPDPPAQSRFAQYWQPQGPSRAEIEAQRTATIKDRLDKYDRLWSKLSAPGGDYFITVEQVPWPLVTVPQHIGPEQFSKSAIAEFVFHPYRLEGPSLTHSETTKFKRSRVKEELLRWHPDKFRSKALTKVVPAQRELVEQCAEAVAKALNALKGEL